MPRPAAGPKKKASARLAWAVAKVTWPSRRETAVTTLMVLVMVVLAALFFLTADQILAWGVETILGR